METKSRSEQDYMCYGKVLKIICMDHELILLKVGVYVLWIGLQ
jgi:hypothetical protein